MRHLLLAVATVISSSCAGATNEHEPALDTDAYEPEQSSHGAGPDEPLVGFDLRFASGEPNRSPLSGARVDTPQDDRDTEGGHHNDAVLLGPLPRPTAPNPSGELMPILTWIGTVLLNTETGSPFDVPDLSPYLAPALATAHESRGHELASTSNVDSHRAVLVNSWTDGETSTATLVDAVLIYERTSGTGTTPLPGFQLVSVTFAAQRTELRWQIVALQVSAA